MITKAFAFLLMVGILNGLSSNVLAGYIYNYGASIGGCQSPNGPYATPSAAAAAINTGCAQYGATGAVCNYPGDCTWNNSIYGPGSVPLYRYGDADVCTGSQTVDPITGACVVNCPSGQVQANTIPALNTSSTQCVAEGTDYCGQIGVDVTAFIPQCGGAISGNPHSCLKSDLSSFSIPACPEITCSDPPASE